MSSQATQKKVHSENENDANKFKDIEEAIQKAINTENAKTHNQPEKRNIGSAK